MGFRFDFEHDLKLLIHSAFSSIGVRIPIRADFADMLLDYLTINKKYVRPIPRLVSVSPELETKLLNHPKSDDINHLKNLFVNGSDVNAFQSDKLFHSRFHDHLLYEWNIYHFHLSQKIDKKSRFVERTNLLLFVYINNQQAVLLDVESHKTGIFGHEKWIEILDVNFPHLIEQYLAKNITDVYPQVNSVERQQLWDKGYTYGLIKINGKIYHSPGIGRTTSGHSILVTMEVDKISEWIFSLTEQFSNRLTKICIIFGIDIANAKFKLQFGKKTFEIIEENSGTAILTYPQIFDFLK